MTDGKAYSLRRWFGSTVVVLGSLVLILVILVGVSSFELLRVVRGVARDAESMAVTSNLEIQLLLYNRLSNLYLATGDKDLLHRKDSIHASLYVLLDRAHATIGDALEAELVENVDSQMRAYLTEREALDDSGLEVPGAIDQMRPRLERLLASVDALQMQNDEAMAEATERALHVTWRNNVIAVAIALVLLGAMLAMVLMVRRYALRPIIDLADSIDAFRRGDQRARAVPQGASEIRHVAEMSNQLIDVLLRQRQDQIALTAGVAHDLRNPLAGLNMTLQMLEGNPHVRQDMRSSRSVSLARRQLVDMTRMLDDFLDSARIESGHLDLRIEEMDLREAVLETVECYRSTASGHELSFQDPEAPVFALADAVRMRQVLGNLVSNAIKYSPGDGPVEITLRTSADHVVISVTDEGLGIPPEQIRDLFMPFRRRPDADRIASGAGLGLSVSSRIVTAHGGRIEVDSVPGEGSTFRVVLPRHPAPLNPHSDG